MAVTKSVSQEICWKKWGRNLLADLVTLTKSASQGNMPEEKVEQSAGRFSDCPYICQSGDVLAELGGALNLLADSVIVTKSASWESC